MKEILDLKEKRNAAYEAMQAIVDKAKGEKRSVNADEQKEWSKFDQELKDLDVQINILQRSEDLKVEHLRGAAPKNVVTPEQKVAKRFNLFKAIGEAARGQLTGVEAEICQEGVNEFARSGIAALPNSIIIPSNLMQIEKRAGAEIGTGDGTPPIRTDAGNILSIVKTPNILDKLGVTYYEGLVGNFKLPTGSQLTATFVNEKSAVDGAGTALAADTLAPRRVGSEDFYSKELLSQTSMQIQNQLLQDFIDAIWRAVQKDLFSNVATNATSITGYAITDTVAALDRTALLALEKTIMTGYDGMAFVCSPAQRAKLKALIAGGSGSGIFEWTNDQLIGYPAYATPSLSATNGGKTNTAFDVLFGYWKAAIVGSWGGVELIVDPYANASKGELKIIANGLFDTSWGNALHFSKIRNADC